MATYLFLLLLGSVLSLHPRRMDRLAKKPEATQAQYQTLWFQEDLDHINRDPGTIKIRVLKVVSNSSVTDSQSPMIVYTGNEGPIDDFFSWSGFLTQVVPQRLKANVYFIEHRYYGQSLPSPFSWNYLNTDQVLYDYADIIQQLRPSNYTPVIVVGGSYGGMLAAWMRMKFPHIVDGAIASSAPVLMGLDNGEGYATSVTQVLQALSPNCSNYIQWAFGYLSNLRSNSGYYPLLSSIFRPCKAFTTAQDVTNLMNWLTNGFQTVVQSNYPGNSNVDMPLDSWPANVTCQYFTNYFGSAQHNIWSLLNTTAQAANHIYNFTGTQTCFDMDPETADVDQTWTYQTCTELYNPLGTNNITDIFPPDPWNAQTFNSFCSSTYGVTPNPSWVKVNYGMTANFSRALKYTSNIAFINGAMDPWRYGCIQNVGSNPSLYTHVIAGGAHHTDLRLPTPLDPVDVNSTRETELALIQEWAANKQKLLNGITTQVG